ncbi:MAG: oxygen-independent coproporphyrinogen oxidase [Clostridia bacterium]|jgi:oxygen-independent coproporphyrinogen-3 oxidase|nr:oxygen-independent coproporphyrinogen oxidase [Clostridia bacterium]
MKEIGLYIHIPFCKQKCLYCDFNSYVCSDAQVDSYIEALIKEIRMYNNEHQFKYKTIYIGGGTPTFIHYRHIEAIMQELRPYIAENAEISMECNPGTVNSESLRAYRAMGINRLSMGLQAWQPELQKRLGRIHDTVQFMENLQEAVKAGFENISLDLMFALPDQSLEMWLETVENAASLPIKHISCYSLKVEEGTPFYKLYQENKLNLPEDELDREMYHKAVELLEGKGFLQYEISNFALPGYECRHNLIYWLNREYLGVGAGSHSKLDNIRFNNFKSLNTYIEAINNEAYPIEEKISIDKKEDMWETIILTLRLNRGLDIAEFNRRYDEDFEELYKGALQKLTREGLLALDSGKLRLTSLGMDLSNTVFIEFMD